MYLLVIFIYFLKCILLKCSFLKFLTRLGLLLCGLFSCSQWGLLYSCGTQAASCGSFSCYRAQDLRRVGFSSCGSQTLEHRLSSCGTRSQLLLTNQGLNLCLPYCQADCSPLSYQGSPVEVQLIYSVLISAIQQSDSLRHTHTHTHTHTYIYIILFHIFSIIVYHRILIQFSVLYRRTVLFIHSMYCNSLYLLIAYSPRIPPCCPWQPQVCSLFCKSVSVLQTVHLCPTLDSTYLLVIFKLQFLSYNYDYFCFF